MGIGGAAFATVISQYVSGVGITIYVLKTRRDLYPERSQLHFNKNILKEIANLSCLTCLQQSVMNFGILIVQGLDVYKRQSNDWRLLTGVYSFFLI